MRPTFAPKPPNIRQAHVGQAGLQQGQRSTFSQMKCPWLTVAAETCFGSRMISTRLQVIARGEADRIWHMIYRLQTEEPV